MSPDLSAGDGSGLPSVTRVIDAAGLGADFSSVPADTLDVARVRGSMVHSACEYAALGDLDDASVPGFIRGYVDAFRAFVADVGWHPITIETRLTHPVWRYTGQPDAAGWIGTDRVQVDLKTPSVLAHGPVLLQLAAYAELHAAHYPTEPLQGVATLQLRRDGTYRLRRRDPLEIARAWRTFLAALRLLRQEANADDLLAIDRWTTDYDPMRRTAA